LRRTEREIKQHGADRQQHERDDRGDAAVPACGSFRHGCIGIRDVGGGQQPARYFDAGGFSLGFANETGGAVADDLVQLVAVDGDIAAAVQRRATTQRP
jgi:hypothetical protein